MKKLASGEKGRVWAFVLYPDSCLNYKDMIKKLEHLGVSMAISPLHIPEKNKVQENEKKQHYHILFYLDGQKTQEQLRKMLDMSITSYDAEYFDWSDLVAKGHPEELTKLWYPYFLKVNSVSAYFRYLIHLDDPDKQQFNDYKITNFIRDDEEKYNTIVLLNGFNCRDYLKNVSYNPNIDIVKIVRENNFTTINQLIDYLAYTENHYLLNYCQTRWSFLKNFLLYDLFYTVPKKN